MQIGIIGCGKQAPKHISGLLASQNVKKIIVADINAAMAQKLAANYDNGKVIAAESVDAIFENPDIDGVSICTPTPFHGPLIRQALASQKHYLCEKPLCDSLTEAQELSALTEKSGLIGMVGFIYRYAPVFERGLELMGGKAGNQSAVFGTVSNAFFRIGGRGSQMPWKHLKAGGGGALNEMLVHMLDLSQWFFGKAVDVKLIESNIRWPERMINGEKVIADAEDFVLAKVTTEHGVDVLFQADMITPAFIQYTEIQGTNGSLVASIQPNFSNFVHCIAPAADLPAGRNELTYRQANLYEGQMGDFVNAIKDGGETRCSVSNSVAVLQTMEDLRKQL